MKNKSLLSIEKNIKREKTPYNYQKILLVFLKSNDIEKYLNEEQIKAKYQF